MVKEKRVEEQERRNNCIPLKGKIIHKRNGERKSQMETYKKTRRNYRMTGRR